jgi:hypothetical protein
VPGSRHRRHGNGSLSPFINGNGSHNIPLASSKPFSACDDDCGVTGLTRPCLRNKPAWFEEISPYSKVPVLVHGEHRIWESNVINEYLQEAFPERRLTPQTAPRRPTCGRSRANCTTGHSES